MTAQELEQLGRRRANPTDESDSAHGAPSERFPRRTLGSAGASLAILLARWVVPCQWHRAWMDCMVGVFGHIGEVNAGCLDSSSWAGQYSEGDVTSGAQDEFYCSGRAFSLAHSLPFATRKLRMPSCEVLGMTPTKWLPTRQDD